MRLLGFIAVVFGLGACDSPSPNMRDGVAHHLERDGHRFTVWQKDNRVEVIRLSYAPRGTHTHLREVMLQAIVDATGCTPRAGSVDGDSGVLRAALTCP